MLSRPDFKLDQANPNSGLIPDSVWWLWLRLHELEATSKLGGIYANKSGFHNTGVANKARWPSNYSIRDSVNQSGVGWTKASALDWTFPDAQRGDYKTIDKYTSRLIKSALDANDPRLDTCLFEFYGQGDFDLAVEGYNEYREDYVSSDSSHLWHIHMSFIRSKVGDYWGMWAVLTVLMGWTVAQWKATLPAGTSTPAPKPSPVPAGIPVVRPGSRMLRYVDGKPMMKGTDIQLFQRWVGIKADGIFGPKSRTAAKAYQRMRGLTPDGIVGPKTWAPILRAL